MIVKDHWRITTAAIQLEMERISGLLEKSERYKKRFAAAEAARALQAASASAAPVTPVQEIPCSPAGITEKCS